MGLHCSPSICLILPSLGQVSLGVTEDTASKTRILAAHGYKCLLCHWVVLGLL